MANIFRKKDSYIDRVNRSTFDLSFVNNLTMKFGAITPVCLLPVSFGDSFQINARFNLQLLPTVFPIQTQLYVRLHFVYVRTRTLWEDWMSFFGGDETVTPPWMDPFGDNNTPDSKVIFNIPDDLQTGTLADYLGVPTVITGNFGKTAKAVYAPLSLLAPVNLSNLIRGLLIRPNPPEDISSLVKAVRNSQLVTYFGQPAIYPSDGSADTDNSSWLTYLFNTYTDISLTKGSVFYFDLGFNVSLKDFGVTYGVLALNSDNAIPVNHPNFSIALVSGTLYSLTLLDDYPLRDFLVFCYLSSALRFLLDELFLRL